MHLIMPVPVAVSRHQYIGISVEQLHQHADLRLAGRVAHRAGNRGRGLRKRGNSPRKNNQNELGEYFFHRETVCVGERKFLNAYSTTNGADSAKCCLLMASFT